ncbi:hypothetical protein Tco_1263991 [Tanacetum coccineum]
MQRMSEYKKQAFEGEHDHHAWSFVKKLDQDQETIEETSSTVSNGSSSISSCCSFDTTDDASSSSSNSATSSVLDLSDLMAQLPINLRDSDKLRHDQKCKNMKRSQDMQLIQKLRDDQKRMKKVFEVMSGRNIVTNSRVTPSWREIVSLTFSEAGVLHEAFSRLAANSELRMLDQKRMKKVFECGILQSCSEFEKFVGITVFFRNLIRLRCNWFAISLPLDFINLLLIQL